MNPYRTVLGIETPRRPNLFQLLGVSESETDPKVIKAAANAQMQKLRPHKDGPQGDACKQLASEIKRAYQILVNPEQREKYLSKLSAARRQASASAKPIAEERSVPVAAGSPSGAASNGILILLGVAATMIVLVGVGAVAYSFLGGSTTTVASNTSISDQSESATRTEDPLGLPTLPANMNGDVTAAANVPPESTLDVPAAAESLDPSVQIQSDGELANVPASKNDDLESQPPVMESPSSDSPTTAQNSVTANSVAANSVTANSIKASDTETVSAQGIPNEPTEIQESDLEPTNSTPTASEPVNTDPALAIKTEAIVRQHCYRCHGENETDEGGFNFALAREKLISSGFIVPGNTKDSLLYERLVSVESPMPPEGESPRPTEQETEIVRSWIQAGAKPFKDLAPRSSITTEQQYELVAQDLNRVPVKERVYVRYFSVTHLSNAGYSEDEIQIYKLALAKLLNSLSWNRKLASLHAVQQLPTVYRIDLRDLKWTNDSWNSILEHYPFGLLHSLDAAISIRDETNSQVPLVRADWFISAASRPPLYHQLAQIPDTDRKLEKLLQVDVRRNITENRVLRAGFTRSGVSQHNRLIERHGSIFGAYWKSYDFAGSTGRKNLFDLPLGPGPTATDFDHDGGEIIFRLPNGMLAYMLTDEQGNRIDKGPTSIVSDPRQPDRAVVNGVSCMSCHYGGFIQKTDEIRKHITANKAAYPKADDILDLYPEAATSSQAIANDTKAYLTALADSAIGITQPTRAGEPIVLASLRYNNELDLSLAAAELGITADDLLEQLGKLSDANLSRRVGALLSKGGVVKRETFVESFFQLTSALNLGRKATVAPAQAVAGVAPVVPAPPVVKRIDITSLPLGTRSGEAETALAMARRVMSSTKWREAAPHFETAIRKATTPTIRFRVCEEAIKFYERMDAVEPLLDAYRYIVNSCRSSQEAKQARDRLFASLEKMITKDTDWSSKTASVEWPISTTRAIADTFEPQLVKYPNHEPTLRVLESFYAKVSRDARKQMIVLGRLDKILTARGESLDRDSAIALAKSLTETGNRIEGAQLFERIAKSAFGAQAAELYLLEADAWAEAGNKAKALTALRQSLKLWKAARTHDIANAYVKLGDTYMKLGERADAAQHYRSALVAQASDYRVEELQAKLAEALGQQAPTVSMAANSNTGPGDARAAVTESNEDLLDPKRRFRIEAESAEAAAVTSPSMMTTYMIQAAEHWIKAGDKQRAIKATKKAVSANQQPGISAASHYPKLAKLFMDTGENQLALEQWALALKSTKSSSSIGGYQAQIAALLQDDSSLKVDETVKPLLDPNHTFRVQAKQAEATQSYDSYGRATNLLRAGGYWQQAGDNEDALRCIVSAEKAIATISDTAGSRLETSYRQISDIYAKIEMPKDEVRNLIATIKHCRSDSSAQRDFERIKLVCQRHAIPVPELDPASAKKLDPLNRYREKAAEYEKGAIEHASSASTYYSMAVNSWTQAKETDHAIRVANEWARTLLKDKTDRQFESNIGRLADVFIKLDRKDAAKKCYEEQLKAATTDYRKKSAQKKLDQLNDSQP